jgi:hypothetical protein
LHRFGAHARAHFVAIGPEKIDSKIDQVPVAKLIAKQIARLARPALAAGTPPLLSLEIPVDGSRTVRPRVPGKGSCASVKPRAVRSDSSRSRAA